MCLAVAISNSSGFLGTRFEYDENIENISNESKIFVKVRIGLEINNNSRYLIQVLSYKTNCWSNR